MERVPNTLLLMIPAEIIVIAFSLVVGIFSALRQYSITDHIITGFSFVGYSMPIFFVALVSMYIFAVKFKAWGLPYLPTVGMFDPKIGKTSSQVALHMVLPIFSMTVITVAGYSRYVRPRCWRPSARTIFARRGPKDSGSGPLSLAMPSKTPPCRW